MPHPKTANHPLPLILLLSLCLVTSHAQSVRRDFWLGIPGSSVDNLIASPDYPSTPSGTDFPTIFEGPSNWADDYGTRIRGFVNPPTTGDYIFWISGDDNSLLYLGSNESPSSVQLIASVNSWTSSREWNREPQQQSAPVRLEAGKSYYIEALHKEGAGGDNIAVGWQLPDGTLERPIPGNRLSPFMVSFDPPSITSEPQDLELEEGQQAVFQVSANGAEPLVFQWERNTLPIPGENLPRLTISPVTLADDEATFRCVISNPLGTTITRTATLRVRSETVPPELHETRPAPGSTIRSFSQVVVRFTESVQGVHASDLLANNQPATSVNGIGAGPYTFSFNPKTLTPGSISLSWNPDHNITDTARIPNPFQPSPWTCELNPTANFNTVQITEFLASNSSGLTDEDGEAQDWLELWNNGISAVNLTGWALSDDPKNPAQWTFPDVSIPGGGRLVVYASGKDRKPTTRGSRLHTNFKLSRSGEPLALYSPEQPPLPLDGFTSSSYPEQRTDISYVRNNDGTWDYCKTPTPGFNNSSNTASGITAPPVFSSTRGHYASPISLYLNCPTPGATIRYTTDGSEPTPTQGTDYSQPIPIITGTVVRAAAFHPDLLPSDVVSHTLLAGRSSRNRFLPTLSLAASNSDLWGPTGIMEPGNTVNHGIAWERPVSVEYFLPEDNTGFALNAGLRIQGGGWVRERYSPSAGLPYSKYSFRLYFRGDYGSSKLNYPLFPDCPINDFERIVLRAGMNDHSNPFLVDELVRRLHANMGAIASHGTFVHLHLNGSYKGVYNPTERIDVDFLRSYTQSTNDWDLIAQFNELQAGDMIEWNRLSSTILGRDMSDPANYAAAASQLDIDAFIDYLLLNIYTANGDWPWNNWRAARERKAGAKWFFIVWDAEWSFGNSGRSVYINTITEELAANAPIANFFRALTASPEFRHRFADRFEYHMNHNGALTDENVLAQYLKLRNTLLPAIPGLLDTIQAIWIPQRRNLIIEHLKNAGLYASDHTPSLNQHGGTIPPGFNLTLQANAGNIYYTTDGTDPASSPNSTIRNIELVNANTPKKALVPSTANGGSQLGNSWTGGNEPFNDSAWQTGTAGAGYDLSADYQDFIGINLLTEMSGLQPSVFLRIPFTLNPADLQGLEQLKLQVRYDDGFVAMLNGVVIASANAPDNPAWNSSATTSNPDNAAVEWQLFDVSDHLNTLQAGQNILTIQGLNVAANSSDMLIDALLTATEPSQWLPSPTAIPYTTPFTLTQSATVKARTLLNDEWSALLEAPFLVNLPSVPLRITEIMYHPEGNEALEFVEISNLASIPVTLDNLRIQGVDFTFPANSTIQGGQSIIIASNLDPVAFAQRYPQVQVSGFFNGSLSNSGERLALLDPNGAVIHSVTYDDSFPWPTAADGHGHSLELSDPYADPDAAGSWFASSNPLGSPGSANPIPAPPRVLLSEILTENLGTTPHEGSLPDWIELHNPTTSSAQLGNWSISDNSNPRRYVFPANATIPAGGFLVVWADTNLTTSGLHLGFSLKTAGETLSLYDANTNRIDSITFGPTIPNLTIGRLSTTSPWTLCNPSPGTSNKIAPSATPDQATINEWLANPLPGEDDWIEIHNLSSSFPLALKDYSLSHAGHVHRFTSPIFIPTKGFLLIHADEQPGPDHTPFKISASGGNISLISPSGNTINTVTYASQSESVSSGRFPDGTGRITEFPFSATPGQSNFLPSPTSPRINEFLADNRSLATDFQGRTADWIELHNPGSTTYDLSNCSLAIGNPSNPDWTFPASTLLQPGGYLLITCEPSLPNSTQPQSVPNIARGLPRDGTTLTLLSPQGTRLDQISYGPQIPDKSCGFTPSGWTLLASPTPASINSDIHALGTASALRINEWLTNPLSSSPWIELLNTSTLPITLSGLTLSNDPSIAGLLTTPTIAPLSYISASGRIVFTADNQPGSDPTHLPFELSPWAGNVVLADNNSIIDTASYGPMPTDASLGRFPDGSAEFVPFISTPSPGEPNYLPLTKIVINEILAHTDPPLEDAIELYNLTSESVNVGGWFLSDDPDDLRKFRIPANTTIPANSYLVIYQYQLDGGPGSITPFTLNSYLGDSIYLSEAGVLDTLTGYRSQFHFGPTANGVSLGRVTTSIGHDFAPQLNTSFGTSNPTSLTHFRSGTGAPNPGPVIGPITIQEILATPPDLGDFNNPAHAEFLEIANLSNNPIPLYDSLHPENTWRISGGIQFSFPQNTTLQPLESILLVGFNPSTNPEILQHFLHRYLVPAQTRVLGPFEGRLANEGETIALERPDNPQTSGPDTGLVPYVLVEQIKYTASTPWPTNGIGLGNSLQKASPDLYANDPANWLSAIPTAGRRTPRTNLDADNDGMLDDWETGFALDPSNADDANADNDQDGMSNYAEFVSGTNPTSAASRLALNAQAPSGNHNRLLLETSPGISYSILYLDTLAGNWTPLINIPATSGGGWVEITDPIPASPHRFYRVQTPSLP